MPMKIKNFFSLLLLLPLPACALNLPINNGVLTGDLNANGHAMTNVGTIKFADGTTQSTANSAATTTNLSNLTGTNLNVSGIFKDPSGQTLVAPAGKFTGIVTNFCGVFQTTTTNTGYTATGAGDSVANANYYYASNSAGYTYYWSGAGYELIGLPDTTMEIIPLGGGIGYDSDPFNNWYAVNSPPPAPTVTANGSVLTITTNLVALFNVCVLTNGQTATNYFVAGTLPYVTDDEVASMSAAAVAPLQANLNGLAAVALTNGQALQFATNITYGLTVSGSSSGYYDAVYYQTNVAASYAIDGTYTVQPGIKWVTFSTTFVNPVWIEGSTYNLNNFGSYWIVWNDPYANGQYIEYTNSAIGGTVPPTTGWGQTGNGSSFSLAIATNVAVVITNVTPGEIGAEPAGTAAGLFAGAYQKNSSGNLDYLYGASLASGVLQYNASTLSFSAFTPQPINFSTANIWTNGALVSLAAFATLNTNVLILFGPGTTASAGVYYWQNAATVTNNVTGHYNFTYTGYLTNYGSGYWIVKDQTGYFDVVSTNKWLYKIYGTSLLNYQTSGYAPQWQAGHTGDASTPYPYGVFRQVIDFSQPTLTDANVIFTNAAGSRFTVQINSSTNGFTYFPIP
jgi:hypothetical protein